METTEPYVGICREVFRRADNDEFTVFTASITLTETLILPMRTENADLENQYRAFLWDAGKVTLIPIDVPVAVRAAELRARYNLKTPDALQIAAAVEAGCEAFLTNHDGLRRVTDLRVLVLKELTAA